MKTITTDPEHRGHPLRILLARAADKFGAGRAGRWRTPIPTRRCREPHPATLCQRLADVAFDVTRRQTCRYSPGTPRFGLFLLGELRHSGNEWHDEAGGGKTFCLSAFLENGVVGLALLGLHGERLGWTQVGAGVTEGDSLTGFGRVGWGMRQTGVVKSL